MTTATGHALPHQGSAPEQTAQLDKFPKYPFPLPELQQAWKLGGWRSIHWLSSGKNEHAELTTGAGRFFLRRSYRSKTRQALQFQVELLAALRAAGFPAPVPVPAASGECIVAIPETASEAKAAQDRLYMVTEALPGAAYHGSGDDGVDLDLLRTMGRELARFHHAVGSFGLADPEAGRRDLLDGVREKLAAMDVAAGPDLHARGVQIAQRLEQLDTLLPRTIMHGGFRRGSLLFLGGAVSGFLDVDSARSGPRALDLATALHDIGKVYTEKGRDDHKVVLDLDKIAVFLAGYRELAAIEPVEAEAIGVMIEAKRVKRALGRCERLDAGEVLSENDHIKIDMERARLAWLDANLPHLQAICAD